jgi:hypothetical protein
MGETRKSHSFRPLLFVPPQGHDALPPTVREPRRSEPKALGGAGDSHIRLRAMPAASIDWLEAHDLLDQIGDEQLALGVSLSCLEQAVAYVPRDAHDREIAKLVSCATDLGALRDALASVQVAAVDRRVQRLFLPDAPLAEYVCGVYAWMHAVMGALDAVATALRTSREPDLALLGARLEEANNFHFDELHGAIRADLTSLEGVPASDDLIHAVIVLVTSARALEASLATWGA